MVIGELITIQKNASKHICFQVALRLPKVGRSEFPGYGINGNFILKLLCIYLSKLYYFN